MHAAATALLRVRLEQRLGAAALVQLRGHAVDLSNGRLAECQAGALGRIHAKRRAEGRHSDLVLTQLKMLRSEDTGLSGALVTSAAHGPKCLTRAVVRRGDIDLIVLRAAVVRALEGSEHNRLPTGRNILVYSFTLSAAATGLSGVLLGESVGARDLGVLYESLTRDEASVLRRVRSRGTLTAVHATANVANWPSAGLRLSTSLESRFTTTESVVNGLVSCRGRLDNMIIRCVLKCALPDVLLVILCFHMDLCKATQDNFMSIVCSARSYLSFTWLEA